MITENTRKSIARDFHFTKMSTLDINKKYNIKPATVSRMATRYPREAVYIPQKYQLLKFPEDQHLKAMDVLQEYGIDFEETTEHFELLESYESSINGL